MNNDQVPKEQVRNSIFFDNFHACFSTIINYFHRSNMHAFKCKILV